MKRKIIFLLILATGILITIFLLKKDYKFYLDDKYYGLTNIKEINSLEYEELIKNKESFTLLIYEPMCNTSQNFESIVTEFISNENLSIYKMSFSNTKDTNINKFLKYYPSFIIYHNGKVITYLNADKKEDLDCFLKYEEFKSWVSKYVYLSFS